MILQLTSRPVTVKLRVEYKHKRDVRNDRETMATGIKGRFGIQSQTVNIVNIN